MTPPPSFGVPNALNTLKRHLNILKHYQTLYESQNASKSLLLSVLPLSPGPQQVDLEEFEELEEEEREEEEETELVLEAYLWHQVREGQPRSAVAYIRAIYIRAPLY